VQAIITQTNLSVVIKLDKFVKTLSSKITRQLVHFVAQLELSAAVTIMVLKQNVIALNLVNRKLNVSNLQIQEDHFVVGVQNHVVIPHAAKENVVIQKFVQKIWMTVAAMDILQIGMKTIMWDTHALLVYSALKVAHRKYFQTNQFAAKHQTNFVSNHMIATLTDTLLLIPIVAQMAKVVNVLEIQQEL